MTMADGGMPGGGGNNGIDQGLWLPSGTPAPSGVIGAVLQASQSSVPRFVEPEENPEVGTSLKVAVGDGHLYGEP